MSTNTVTGLRNQVPEPYVHLLDLETSSPALLHLAAERVFRSRAETIVQEALKGLALVRDELLAQDASDEEAQSRLEGFQAIVDDLEKVVYEEFRTARASLFLYHASRVLGRSARRLAVPAAVLASVAVLVHAAR